MASPAALAPSPFVPVVVEISITTHRVCTCPRDCAKLLVNGWPIAGRGPAYQAALRACLAALEGTGPAAVARAAFVAAAKEVDIYVRG